MIEVRGPNGEVFRFPDGTAPDVMQRALQQHFQSAAPAESAPTPRTMAPPPYFRPEQPAPQPSAPVVEGVAPQTPQLGPESLTPNAFGNTRFMPDTAGRPDLNAALRVAADMERMGQPGGGAVFPGPGPAPPGGQPAPQMATAPTMPPGPPLNPNYVPPPPPRLVAQPTNPNLGNEAMFAQQGQTPQGWAGPLEEAMQGAAARQNMNQIVQSRVPPVPEQAPPFAQWVMDNPGTAATLPFAATPIGAWRLGAGLAGNLFRTGAVGAGLGGAAGGIDAAAQGEDVVAGIGSGAGWGGAAGAGIPLVARPIAQGVVGAYRGLTGTAPAAANATSSGLFAGADAALASARQAGLAVDSNALLQTFQDMETILRGPAVAVRRATAERAFNLLDELRQEVASGTALNFDDLFNIRANLRTLYKTQDPAQQAAAASMIREFDRAMEALPQSAIVGGNAADAMGQWQNFRSIYQRASKAEDIEDILFVAQGAANPENSLISQFRRIRNSDTFTKFWTTEEQRIINSIVEGDGAMQKAADFLSRLSSGRLLGAVTGGAAVGAGMPGVAAGIWGLGGLARNAATSGRERMVEELLSIQRQAPRSTDPTARIIAALTSGAGRMAAPEADTPFNRMMQALSGTTYGLPGPRSVTTTAIPAY